MMREILFRGKSIYDGKWLDGDLYHRNEEVLITNFYEGFTIAVYPSTVGQYTGLKDKNGKRIFEGDIIRCGTGRICKVTFSILPGFIGFDLVPVGGFDAPPPNEWLLFADTEIIGNIHDNPELLEGGASE